MPPTRAEDEDAQFGFANIPFGVVSTDDDQTPQIATRLFGHVFKLPTLIRKGLLGSLEEETRSALLKHRQVRELLQTVLRRHQDDDVAPCAIATTRVTYHLPVTVGDFSDFSCSEDHVLNAGEAVTGVRQLPPGFPYFPVGYGGRCSSIVPPGTSIQRPLGQFRASEGVMFGASHAVDFELEMACIIGRPSSLGKPININDADEHIFGFVLLNDWSARDIQGLEMNPLGPFNGKSFGTSISPWIITADALEPFRVSGRIKEELPAPYLRSKRNTNHYAVQLNAEIEVHGARSMVCQSRCEWLYWSVSDMVAHHTINGCPLNAGDILATGTVSGNEVGSHGCLLEITKGGKEPLDLSKGVRRTYLEDGDVVRLTGWAGTPGTGEYVGFGLCYGQLRG
ncbi:hypothetical protein LTR24_001581 [Lithohypha guttulata]|uniref:Fumarylacetoacetase n=1 Tax=Lithohypha guttulata TaxID=1690604 RepID=A0ABR0KK54_9EURO|nr:hypothetical protein LTR24_001581 [Lithohypha guttulata]